MRYKTLRVAGWLTVAEVVVQIGVVPSIVTRGIQRGLLPAEQFPHETGCEFELGVSVPTLHRWLPASARQSLPAAVRGDGRLRTDQ